MDIQKAAKLPLLLLAESVVFGGTHVGEYKYSAPSQAKHSPRHDAEL